MERASKSSQARRLGFCEWPSSRPQSVLGSGDSTEVHPTQRKNSESRFGWHTFRHTYSTLLRSVGTEFKVMQELLRHSSLRSTLDVYTQAISPAKHAAQAAVLDLVLGSETNYPAPAKCGRVMTRSTPETPLIDEKGCKKGAEMHPFAPALVAVKCVQLFWNEWRGRRDSNSRPLP